MKPGPTPLIDAHIYGGALLIAVGFGMWALWSGPVVLGSILLALGTRRP